MQLLSFYNLNNTERIYTRVVSGAEPPSEVMPKLRNLLKTDGKINLVKLAAAVVGFLIVAYMVYDLFLYEPQPATQVVTVDQTGDVQPDTALAVTPDPDAVPMPEDVVYTVADGDTWGRIYQRYEVCSWFIRNHAPNAELFSNSNTLAVGTRLRIPVKYSANASLNPDFHEEFSLDNVGTSCQNADQEFLHQFEAKVNP